MTLSAQDRRVAAQVGRVARLELRFASRRGRTVLAHSYAEPPFRAARALPEGDGLHLIMSSSAPGVFGGDCLEQTICVEPGARVRLTSQSALQAHPSEDGSPAVLRSRYVLGEGAELSCFWDPVIPFAASRVRQRFEIDLAAGARLLWSDGFMAGREARGERWGFLSLAHELRVVREGRLDYLERFHIEDKSRLANRWLGSDCCYFGTTIASGLGQCAANAECLHADLAACPAASAAADLVDRDLLLVRLASSDGPAFHHARGLAHAAMLAPQAVPVPLR